MAFAHNFSLHSFSRLSLLRFATFDPPKMCWSAGLVADADEVVRELLDGVGG